MKPSRKYGKREIGENVMNTNRRDNVANAKLEIIDKSGHYVHMDKPQELVQVVSKFLEKPVRGEVARLVSNG